MLVASTPEQYVESILRVIEEPQERKRLSLAGRARMLSHHAWDKSMRRLDGIIEQCLGEYARKLPDGAVRPRASQ